MTFPLFDLSGRRALVTGSSQGIGRALAVGLAEHGASIIINGRNAQKAEAAAEDIRRSHRHAVSAAFDVTLQRYAVGDRTYRGRIGTVSVPAALAEVVEGVEERDQVARDHAIEVDDAGLCGGPTPP